MYDQFSVVGARGRRVQIPRWTFGEKHDSARLAYQNLIDIYHGFESEKAKVLANTKLSDEGKADEIGKLARKLDARGQQYRAEQMTRLAKPLRAKIADLAAPKHQPADALDVWRLGRYLDSTGDERTRLNSLLSAGKLRDLAHMLMRLEPEETGLSQDFHQTLLEKHIPAENHEQIETLSEELAALETTDRLIDLLVGAQNEKLIADGIGEPVGEMEAREALAKMGFQKLAGEDRVEQMPDLDIRPNQDAA